MVSERYAGATTAHEGAWMSARRAATLALRPDAYVYAAAPAGAPLSPPPSGFTPSAAPRPTRTITQ